MHKYAQTFIFYFLRPIISNFKFFHKLHRIGGLTGSELDFLPRLCVANPLESPIPSAPTDVRNILSQNLTTLQIKKRLTDYEVTCTQTHKSSSVPNQKHYHIPNERLYSDE